MVGVVAQNDDVAQGVIAALNAAGVRPGEDVLVVGADGTSLGAKSIDKGTQLATSANSPAYAAAIFAGRIYDVTHGWRPSAPERLLNWRSLTTTKANVGGYLARYVNNNGVKPFDYRKISKVLHPSDWDPQADVYPLDIDKHWAGIPKPDGWSYPEGICASQGERRVREGQGRIRRSLQDQVRRPVTQCLTRPSDERRAGFWPARPRSNPHRHALMSSPSVAARGIRKPETRR